MKTKLVPAEVQNYRNLRRNPGRQLSTPTASVRVRELALIELLQKVNYRHECTPVCSP